MNDFNLIFYSSIHSRFPAGQYPVYAFPGAPGNFPSLPENHFIQKYLHFSKLIDKISDEYIQNEMEGKPFLAIHLRNGQDMVSFEHYHIFV